MSLSLSNCCNKSPIRSITLAGRRISAVFSAVFSASFICSNSSSAVITPTMRPESANLTHSSPLSLLVPICEVNAVFNAVLCEMGSSISQKWGLTGNVTESQSRFSGEEKIVTKCIQIRRQDDGSPYGRDKRGRSCVRRVRRPRPTPQRARRPFPVFSTGETPVVPVGRRPRVVTTKRGRALSGSGR